MEGEKVKNQPSCGGGETHSHDKNVLIKFRYNYGEIPQRLMVSTHETERNSFGTIKERK